MPHRPPDLEHTQKQPLLSNYWFLEKLGCIPSPASTAKLEHPQIDLALPWASLITYAKAQRPSEPYGTQLQVLGGWHADRSLCCTHDSTPTTVGLYLTKTAKFPASGNPSSLPCYSLSGLQNTAESHKSILWLISARHMLTNLCHHEVLPFFRFQVDNKDLGHRTAHDVDKLTPEPR